MVKVRQIGFICIAVMLTACSQRALHEALHVVEQADSLWTAGQAYDDSISLAQAYNELGRHRSSCPDEYVHACYHYGKLLRTKDDPVGAMQAFINATHTDSHDFHILGRVYSNMGDICHYAGEFTLSYDMFERSADMFLKNGDTLLYYYDLNNMAFELAEQGKKEETLALLRAIEEHCSDGAVLAKTKETKAKLYFQIEQYDSVISAVSMLQAQDMAQTTSYALKARAYWHKEEYDSALYYAKYVLESPLAVEQEKYNMLYIIMNHDSTLSIEEKMEMSAQRSDIETDVLIPLYNGLAVAVQLFKQDLNRKPDRRWLYIVAASIFFVLSLGILAYLWRRRKQHSEIIKDLHEKKKEHVLLKKTINDLSLLKETQHQQLIDDIESACEQIRNSDIRTELCWHNYDKMCHIVNRRLYGLRNHLQPFALSEKEFRLCILIVLQAETKQMVEMIPYAHSGIGKFKYTTARKLGTSTSNMRSFIINLIAH